MVALQWCFGSKGQLIVIRGIIKSEDYIKILDENLQLPVQNLDPGQQFIFQQDNHPEHLNQWLRAFRKSTLHEVLWLSMSPDLNPIEILRQEFKVQMNYWLLKNLQELECVTIEEWKKILEKTCSNLIKNFRKWLQQVIKKRGHAIDY